MMINLGIVDKIAEHSENNVKKYETTFVTTREQNGNFYTKIYSELKSTVVYWKWATDQMFNPEPFYFEETKFKRGEWLAVEPSNKEGFYCYGFDILNRIIIERNGFFCFGVNNNEPVYYETYFYYNALNQVCQSVYFTYDDKEYPTNQYFFEYENDKLIYIWKFFNQSKSNHLIHYHIENDLYQAKYEFNLTTHAIVNSNFMTYRYTKNRQLDSISQVFENRTELIYKAPTNSINLKAVKHWLENFIKSQIDKNKPTDVIYSFFLYYGSEDILPPSLYYGYENYRHETIQNNASDYFCIWQPAEFPKEFELLYLLDFDIPENVFLFMQESKYTEVEQLLFEVAIEIKLWLKQNYSVLLTEDFSVVLTHYESHNLEDFFKRINPEIYDKLKYQFENF